MGMVQGTFDARNFNPDQGQSAHPTGKFRFQITGTEIKPNKDNNGGMLVIELTSDQGKAYERLNLWNQNAQAVDIAHRKLAAYCWCIGVFQLDFGNDAAALRGHWIMADINKQKDSDYTQVGRVYDANGNEPGKAPANPAPAAAPPPAQGGWGGNAPQPPQPQPSPGWGNPAPAPAAAPQQPPQAGWGGNGAVTPPQPVTPPPAAAPQAPQPGWAQQQPANGAPPPPWNGPAR